MSLEETGAGTGAFRSVRIFILTSYLLFLVILVLQFITKLFGLLIVVSQRL